MKKEVKIEVSSNVVSILEKLTFQIEAREYLIKKMMSNKEAINKELFQKYHDEFIEHFTQFELAKKMVEKEFIPECFISHQFTWNLDYATKILTVTQTCDCLIEE